jgi:hypothetical protein
MVPAATQAGKLLRFSKQLHTIRSMISAAKLAVIIIGLVAVLAAMGARGVAATQTHVGSTPGVEDHKIAGSVQSVNVSKRSRFHGNVRPAEGHL